MKGKRNIPCQTESKRKESGNYTVSSVNHKQADIPDLNIYAPSSRGESIFKIYKMMITLKRMNTSSVTGRQSQNKKNPASIQKIEIAQLKHVILFKVVATSDQFTFISHVYKH